MSHPYRRKADAMRKYYRYLAVGFVLGVLAVNITRIFA